MLFGPNGMKIFVTLLCSKKPIFIMNLPVVLIKRCWDSHLSRSTYPR